jgi:hypothetical protein
VCLHKDNRPLVLDYAPQFAQFSIGSRARDHHEKRADCLYGGAFAGSGLYVEGCG